jgi:hypothetical protein
VLEARTGLPNLCTEGLQLWGEAVLPDQYQKLYRTYTEDIKALIKDLAGGPVGSATRTADNDHTAPQVTTRPVATSTTCVEYKHPISGDV